MVGQIQKELERKIKEILKVFREDKNILVAGYVGSVSKGYADKYSDLDIVCITKKDPDYPTIKKKLHFLCTDIETFKDGKKMNYHFDYHGTVATIGFKKLSQINETIKNFNNSSFDLQVYKKLYINFDHKLVFGDKKIIKKIQKQIPKKVPDEVIREGFEKLYKWVVNNVRKNGRLDSERKRKNWISVNYRLNRTMEWVIQLIYLINGIPFQEVRWIYKEIPKMKIKPKNCIAKLDKISKLEGGKKGTKKKILLLRSLVLDLDKSVRKKKFDVPKMTK